MAEGLFVYHLHTMGSRKEGEMKQGRQLKDGDFCAGLQ
jgi:hypothetical protein